MAIIGDFNKVFNTAGIYDVKTPKGNHYNVKIETDDIDEFWEWIRAMDSTYGPNNWEVGPAGMMQKAWEPTQAATTAAAVPTTPTAAPAASKPRKPGPRDATTIAEALQLYRGGEYGQPDNPEARTTTIHQMARIWESTGLAADQALDRATETFDRNIYGRLSTMAGDDGLPVNEQERLTKAFGGLGEAQLAQFRDYLNERVPSSRFGEPYRASLRQNFAPIQTQYALERGLGKLGPVSEDPAANPFADYLRQVGLRRPTTDTLRGLVTDASALLSGPDITDLSDPRLGFQETLRKSPELQKELAFQSSLPRQPFEYQGAAQRAAERAYDAWLLRNTAGQQFLPGFVQRGFKFY